MLVDAVEVDDYKETKDKELKMMNSIMDSRKKKRDAKAEKTKMVVIEKEVDNCVEENSGLIFKAKSRKVSKDELLQKVTLRRKYLDLGKIDSKE